MKNRIKLLVVVLVVGLAAFTFFKCTQQKEKSVAVSKDKKQSQLTMELPSTPSPVEEEIVAEVEEGGPIAEPGDYDLRPISMVSNQPDQKMVTIKEPVAVVEPKVDKEQLKKDLEASRKSLIEYSKDQVASVGISEEKPVDNPSDNVFHVSLDEEITSGTKVWLQYDLKGVKDHTQISKSVNDQLAFGGYMVQTDEEED